MLFCACPSFPPLQAPPALGSLGRREHSICYWFRTDHGASFLMQSPRTIPGSYVQMKYGSAGACWRALPMGGLQGNSPVAFWHHSEPIYLHSCGFCFLWHFQCYRGMRSEPQKRHIPRNTALVPLLLITTDTWFSTPPCKWIKVSLLCRRAQAQPSVQTETEFCWSEAGATPLIPQLKPICTNNLGSLPIAVFYAAKPQYWNMRQARKGRGERKREKRTRNMTRFYCFSRFC